MSDHQPIFKNIPVEDINLIFVDSPIFIFKKPDNIIIKIYHKTYHKKLSITLLQLQELLMMIIYYIPNVHINDHWGLSFFKHKLIEQTDGKFYVKEINRRLANEVADLFSKKIKII